MTTLLLGHDASGKTTTLRTIMGLWRASKERIARGDAIAKPARGRRRASWRRL
jgi:ABC-type branched-subunit amino acid transport system ATPase component